MVTTRRSAIETVPAPVSATAQDAEDADTIAQEMRQAARRAPMRRRGVGREAEAKLHEFSTLPEYLADNEYIQSYYRVDYSIKDGVKSLFRIHNETGNIWTHLIGFLLFLGLTVLLFHSPPAPLVLGAEKLAMLERQLYEQGRSGLQGMLRAEKNLEHKLWGAGERLEKLLVDHGREGIDALWRLEQQIARVGNEKLAELAHFKDEKVQQLVQLEERLVSYGTSGVKEAGKELLELEKRLMKGAAALLDVQWPVTRWPLYIFMAGTMCCLLTSAVCHLLGCCQAHVAVTVWRFDYAGIVVLIVTSFVPPVYYGFMCNPGLRAFYLISTTLLGLMTVAVSLLSFFQATRFRVFRASLFAALGLWGIAPACHILYLYWNKPAMVHSFAHAMVMGVIYVLGAFIYAMRVPERWKPGAFDIVLHSHQLFHLCVVAAALVHYRGILILLHWRDSTGGCDLPLASTS